jgi:hypothetical protein
MNELGLKNESLHHADLVFCRKLREECGLSWATTRASASAALVTARPLPPTPVPPPPPRPPPHRPLPLPPHFLLCPRMSMCRRLVLFLLKRQSRWLLLPCRCLSPCCCRPSITTSSLPTPATAALLAPPPPLPDPVAHNCPTPPPPLPMDLLCLAMRQATTVAGSTKRAHRWCAPCLGEGGGRVGWLASGRVNLAPNCWSHVLWIWHVG